jgi:hypothetical protein
MLLARHIMWGLALVATLTVGAASPAGASPLAPAQEVADDAIDPCVADASQRTGQWDCLPFYRWANEADSFYSNFGRSDARAVVMQPVVSLLYGIAGLMWRLLQWITRSALAFDLFNSVEGGRSTPVPLQPVNDGFAAIARVVLSGFGITVLVLAVFVVIVRVVRDGGTPLRDLARPFLCFGLLLFLLSRAVPQPGGGAQVGSPAWVAQRGVGMSNVVGDQISSVAPQRADEKPPDNMLDCYYYVRQLRESFERRDEFDGDLVGSVAFQPQLASHMSALWEAAYLDLWIEAQFGRDDTLARRAYCRMLEDRSHISPSDQAALTQSALDAEGASVPAAGLSGTAPFGRFNDGKDFRRGMIGWATCGWYADRHGLEEELDARLVPVSGAGFAVNPEFRLMWNLGSPPSEVRDETCSTWWGTDGSGTTKPPPRGSRCCMRDGDGPFHFGDQGDIDEAFTVYGEEELGDATATGGDVAPYAEQDRENLPVAREWVLSLNGHNLTESVPNAILAMIIAGVYLWAIGGLALGTLVAQFLILLFFVSLPLLLLVGMWPSAGSGRVFWRCTKTGAGSLFAKAAFVALLSVLMTLISIINRLGEVTGAFETSDGAQVHSAGFGGVMLQAAAPVVAIWAMRWVLKDLGMGNIFSIKGAMGLTGRLARGPNAHSDQSGVTTWTRARWQRSRNTKYAQRKSRTEERRKERKQSRKERRGSGGRSSAGDEATGRSVRAKRVLKGGLAVAAGGAVLASPLAGALFVSPPVVGGLALAGWAARRSYRNRVGSGDVPDGHGRAPTADDLAGAGLDRVGDAYGSHAATVVAAGNVADPAGAAHHPDVRPPPADVTRGVRGDGRVYVQGPAGLLVPATAGWGARDGETFSAPRGYRASPPAGTPLPHRPASTSRIARP